MHLLAKRKRLVILAVLLTLGLLICIWLSTADLDLLLRYSHRVPVLPTAQAEYQHIVEKIGSATEDALLLDEMSEKPRLYRDNVGCIGTQGSRTYGTNRSQEDIEKDYITAFSPMVWEPRRIGPDFKAIGTSTKTTDVTGVFIDPISPDFSIGKGKYRIIYRVNTVYADPQIFGCFY